MVSVFMVVAVGSVSADLAAVSEVYFENSDSIPDSIGLDEGVTLEGAAEGSSLTYIEIAVRDGPTGIWEPIESESCDNSNTCNVGVDDYSPDHSGSKQLHVYAEAEGVDTLTDVSSMKEVEFTKASPKVDIDLKSPEGSIDDESPEYSWEVEYERPNVDKVTLAVDDDSSPFDGSLHKETFQDYNSEADVNRVIEYQPSNDWNLEDRGDYTWGIKVEEDGETYEEKMSFNVNLDSNDDDSDSGDGDNGDNDDDDSDSSDDENDVPNVDLRSPDGDISDRSPRYKWIVYDDDDHDMEDVRLVVDDDGYPFSNPIHSRSFDEYDSEGDANEFIRFQPPSSWDLERGEDYTWGVEVDDGEDTDSETESFYVESRDDYDSDPDADFTYSPSSPEVDEEVSFDAGRSSDDEGIVDYDWEFGDGSSNSGREVTHSFDSRGSYPVTLTVEDDSGQTDSRTRYVDVDRPERVCGVSERDISLSLEDYTITEGESTDAEVRVFNSADQPQDIEVRFKVDNNVVDERTVTVSSHDSRTVTERVSPDKDSFIRAQVSTEGDPCGSLSFPQLNKQLVVLQDTEEDANLDVEVEDEYGDAIRGAEIRVSGPEDRTRYTDRGGNAGFGLEPGDYEVTVSHSDYRTESEDIRLYEDDQEQLEFTLEKRRSRDTGTLEVTVLDEDGDWVKSRVEVDGPEDQTRLTDSRGFTRFRLEEGSYDIQVEELGGRSRSRTGTVYIDEDEVERRTFRLTDREDGLEITSVDYPDSVCRGDTLSVDYTVRNNEDYDESAQTTASGFDSNIITNTYVVEEGDTVSGTLRFTNVQGSGTERFDIRVQNGTTDRASRTVTVEDCAPTEPPRTDPTSLSMKLSYPLDPNKASVGDTVKVSGFVDGVTSRSQVTIDVNGDRKAKVSTQPDGYYQTFIRMDSIGMKTVTATSGDASSSREIEVLPTANVGYVDAPRKVFEGESYEICSEVNSQIKAKVILVRDGEVVQSTNDKGKVCFDIQASDPGTHTYEVTAITRGESSTSKTTVNVLETDVEVSSFPSQVASVESGDGMVKAELYNTQKEQTRYNLELQDIPSTWLSQSNQQVVLDSGERKTVYFYLTPREEGTYTPELVVDADNQDVYRKEITLEIGGQNQPRSSSFVEKVTGFLGF
ncbi:PKD domain-containing protein [Candidatus Nanohalobium constans]|uniref:PKD domain-containing protein n=2 Tax=Candidatus Nanohalobium constans TaxID=2565781 RepID=A0A5Q0UHG6_9ARCH|nr:PKD domain-containing protein [Candidatus Nanohalobium constans]